MSILNRDEWQLTAASWTPTGKATDRPTDSLFWHVAAASEPQITLCYRVYNTRQSADTAAGYGAMRTIAANATLP